MITFERAIKAATQEDAIRLAKAAWEELGLEEAFDTVGDTLGFTVADYDM